MARLDPPHEDDLRHDDEEYNPAIEPKSAKAWLNLLQESEDAFEDWNTHCDNIDKSYANLAWLARKDRSREFQMLWANMEVVKPAIYAKAPVPVVVPKFKDRRPVYQAAAEFMERCTVVAFDLAYINELMLQVRDDLALCSRGVAWVRYEEGERPRGNGYAKGNGHSGNYYDHEKVCIDFKHRRDFLHSLSRCWYEVSWVAAASYLTRDEARDRFHKHSKDLYQEAEYEVDKETEEVGGADKRERAKFWEIWSKTHRRVVWVAKGCDDILDEGDPHLELQGFFPCPKPAYGVCQRSSLVPVPDPLQYQDQMKEVNLLTDRIHALSDSLELKGFYPSGGGELGAAVEAAVKIKSPGRVLVPIANWATFGGTKEVIIWLPIEIIAQTITALVALRKEIISDIYQIIGLSDIMRGATDPNETLGAQQLKTQYGSSRIRDKQNELVRIARDLVCIVGEVIVEKFDPVTMIEMSQTQLPTQEMQQRQAMEVQQQMANQQQMMQMAMQMPQVQQMQQQNPEAMSQLQQQMQATIQEGQNTIERIMSAPNLEQVLTFLKNNRIRSFVLDIETDSTIMIDENMEKQRRAEFVQMLGALIPQLGQLIAMEPETADFCGEVLKFAVAPFRAGRSLDGAIDQLVEQTKASAKKGGQKESEEQQKGKITLQVEQMKNQRQKERDDADIALKTAELKQRNDIENAKIKSNHIIKMAEVNQRQGNEQGKAVVQNMKAMQSREEHQAHMFEKNQDMAITRAKASAAAEQAAARSNERSQAAADRRAQQQFRMTLPRQPGGRAM